MIGIGPILLRGLSASGLVLLCGGLVGRGFCLRRRITVREAQMVRRACRVARIGTILTALAVLATWKRSGPEWVGAARIVLLGAIQALDVWPSRRLRSWARNLDLDQVPYHTDRDHDRMLLLWKLQLAALLLAVALEPAASAASAPIPGP